MKKNSLIILLSLLVLSSCVTNEYWKLRVEIPRKTPFNLEAYDEIIITQKRGSERVETTYKKFELIASHTCRRSFCTNEYLKGTPALFIMKISGHRTERNFLKYIKVDEQVAAQKMLEFWKSQQG